MALGTLTKLTWVWAAAGRAVATATRNTNAMIIFWFGGKM